MLRETDLDGRWSVRRTNHNHGWFRHHIGDAVNGEAIEHHETRDASCD